MRASRHTPIKTLFLLTVICLFAVGCGGGNTPPATDPSSTPANTSSSDAVTISGLTAAIAEQPALITSAGQSADYEMIKVVLETNEIEFTANMLATKDNFGEAKTLVVAIGGSSKGLGAAGIDADAELKRVEQLLSDAKEAGLTIIAAHIGGDARRGQLGDRYIEPCVKASDYTIVVEAGNADGLFTKIASENNIPIDVVPSINEVIPALGDAFIK